MRNSDIVLLRSLRTLYTSGQVNNVINLDDYYSDHSTNALKYICTNVAQEFDIIYIPEGEYVVDEFSLPARVSLIGKSWESVLKLTPRDFAVDGVVHFIEVMNMDWFCIANLTLDMQQSLMNSGGNGELIHLVNVTGGCITHVHALNSCQDAIDLDNTQRVVVGYNYCENPGKSGVHVSTNSCYNTIIGNRVTGSGATRPTQRAGITQVNGAYANKYVGNVVSDGANRNYEIWLRDGDTPVLFLDNESINPGSPDIINQYGEPVFNA